jgi:hypothetical protein
MNASINVLYAEFEDALFVVLAENACGIAHRSRLFDARHRLRAHPEIDTKRYLAALDRAHARWAKLKQLEPHQA